MDTDERYDCKDNYKMMVIIKLGILKGKNVLFKPLYLSYQILSHIIKNGFLFVVNVRKKFNVCVHVCVDLNL